jgi:hypothetical protein
MPKATPGVVAGLGFALNPFLSTWPVLKLEDKKA